MPLNEDLITSEVCVKCGHCCKWTSNMQSVHPTNGPEWLNIIAKNDNTELLWYDNAMVEHHSQSENKVVLQERAQFKLRFHCPKLVVDEQAGTKMCSIYEDRPKICSDYNCFRQANRTKQRPQNWNYVSGIVEQVHGVKPEWEHPLEVSKIVVKQVV